jgi:hypothetical protein
MALPVTATVAPAQAAAVGYTARTYGPNVTLGKNWRLSFAGSHVTQNTDGSVTSGGPSHYSDNCTTLDIQSFGGGMYVEGIMKYSGKNAGWNTSVGWPCFWANSLEGRSLPFPDNRGIEIDFMEALSGQDNTFAGVIYDWYDSAPDGSKRQVYGTGEIPIPNGGDLHSLHKYGFLWVPATANSKGYAKFFLDDVLITAWQPVWDLYYANQPVPYVVGKTLYSNMDKQHFWLMFGSGDPNPLTVTEVSVWQRDGSQNIPPGTPVKPPVFVVTPDGTIVKKGSTATITDSLGLVWGISADGKMVRDKVTLTETSGVTLITIAKGIMWQQAAANMWWSWQNNAWTPAAGTTVAPITIPVTPAQVAARIAALNADASAQRVLIQKQLDDAMAVADAAKAASDAALKALGAKLESELTAVTTALSKL